MSPPKQPCTLFRLCVKNCISIINSACYHIERSHPESFNECETKAFDLKRYLMSMLPARASTSSSSDSESLPRTPMFEEFIEHSSRRGRASSSSHGSMSPIGALPGSGGDWEVMMLADELEKREREKEIESRRHHFPTTLRDLEEESDTPQRDDSPDEYSNIDDSNSSSTTHLLSNSVSESPQRSLETSFSECRQRESRQHRTSSVGEQIRSDSPLRQSRGLILRAASLDRETTPTTSRPRRFGSMKSASTDSHKRL